MAQYPGAIKSFSQRTDGVDTASAIDINTVYDEIEAIQTELGVNPAGSFATVEDVLDQSAGVKITAKGDLVVGIGANAVTILSIGTNNKFLIADSAQETGLKWDWITAYVDHGSIVGSGDDDHPQYILKSGARPMTANWDAGNLEVRALKFQSDVATGTAPLQIASTTLVANLNTTYMRGYVTNQSFHSGAWHQAGQFNCGVPTGGFNGAGRVNVASGIELNGAAYGFPSDYVFELFYTGEINKYAELEAAQSYDGMMTLAELKVFTKEHWHLPHMEPTEGPVNAFDQPSILIEKIEELYLYLFQQQARIDELKARI